MLIPNLSVLLAERRLTVTKVAQDTGLSRTTLTALTTRSAKGIQFDTLNRLCQYLKVTPDALFIYRPFDLALACDAALIDAPDGTLSALRVRLSLPDATGRDHRLMALLQALPPSVLNDLERDILAAFDARIDPARVHGDYIPDLRWPWDAPF